MRRKLSLKISRTEIFGIPVIFVKFLFVGGLNTIFGLIAYMILVYFGLHFVLATFIATILGIIFNFKTYGALVFKNSDNTLIYRFFMVYVITFCVGISSMKGLFLLGFNKYSAAAIIMLPNALLGFYLNRRFVFGGRKFVKL
jgi:putative flippase GtrA